MKTETMVHLENDQWNHFLKPVTVKVHYNECC